MDRLQRHRHYGGSRELSALHLMQEYIVYSRNDVKGQVMQATKWAHDEKTALSYILRKRPSRDGSCTLKRRIG